MKKQFISAPNNHTPQILQSFKCRDEIGVAKKLARILSAGKDKLHLVCDFDRTLTKSVNDFGETVTTWAMLAKHLPPPAQKEAWKLFNKYRPREIKNELTTKDAVTWWKENLKILIKHKLKWSEITHDVENKMPIREGTAALFDFCQANQVPLIIISAGVKDLIELWCQKHGFKPTLILSTDLLFDDQGYLIGWKNGSLIHARNKKEKSSAQVQEIRKERPNTILLGDSMDDAAMVDTHAHVLKIVIDGHNHDDLIFSKFDLCIKTSDLSPLINLFKHLN